MAYIVERNFVLRQGLRLPVPHTERSAPIVAALLFQPRVVALVALAGTLWQSAAVFAALAGTLWWRALVPDRNPFDRAYNHALGRRPGARALGLAPAPRRFAQGMAGGFAAAIAVSLAAGAWIAAAILQGLLLLAVAALLVERFCLGAFVYHLVRGRTAFAMRTLPWSSRS